MFEEAISNLALALCTFAFAFVAVGILQGIYGVSENHAISRRQYYNFALLAAWSCLLYGSWPWLSRVTAVRSIWGSASLHSASVIGLASVGTLVALDFLQYWIHRALHACRILWWMHKLHHSDETVDSSTGVRHNLFEPLFGALVQSAFIAVFGMPALSVAAYSVLANVQAIVAHADIRLPPHLEKAISVALFTSRLHRLHHLAMPFQDNKNFGVLFSFWDRMFGTFQSGEPATDAIFGLLTTD